MTQNEVSIIKNSVLDATEAYVDARLAMADFVKTQIGVVTANPTKDANNKYRHTVKCNATSGSSGVTYTNVLSVGNIGFPKNSVVFLVAPNAQYSNQFILGKLDSTPANIVGGEIHIGEIANTNPTQYYFNVNNTGQVDIKSGAINLGLRNDNTYNFSVTDNGLVTIKSGSILLSQYGSTNHYNVDINSTGIGVGWNGNGHNFTVAASDGSVAIKKGSINIANKFYADANGNLYVGGTTTSAAKFYVTSTGELHSTSGTIGGFKITNNSLGDPLNSDYAVGMISGQYLYAWSASHHVQIEDDRILMSNAMIALEYGQSWIDVTSQNINSNDKGYVVWHSEVDSNGHVTNSDKNIKKNIKNISNDKIKIFFDNIEPVSFKFRNTKRNNEKFLDNKTHYGIIAQNVKQSLNKAQLTDEGVIKEEDNTLMVYYQEFHGLELAGIKDLYNIVREQQKEIDALKARLEEK